MTLKLFGFPDCPHDFGVTKVDATADRCSFFLDFSRPLKRQRWFGVVNSWIGPTVGLLVPVIHRGEAAGGYVIGTSRGEPYFGDLQALWRIHFRSPRQLVEPNADGFEIIGDFATHFPEDCKSSG